MIIVHRSPRGTHWIGPRGQGGTKHAIGVTVQSVSSGHPPFPISHDRSQNPSPSRPTRHFENGAQSIRAHGSVRMGERKTNLKHLVTINISTMLCTILTGAIIQRFAASVYSVNEGPWRTGAARKTDCRAEHDLIIAALNAGLRTATTGGELLILRTHIYII